MTPLKLSRESGSRASKIFVAVARSVVNLTDCLRQTAGSWPGMIIPGQLNPRAKVRGENTLPKRASALG